MDIKRLTIYRQSRQIKCNISFFFFYLMKTFQKCSLLSSAQQTYGSRECQLSPPKSLSDATSNGSSFFSDFKCDTTSVTFGRPTLATTCCAFGEYFIERPPSSWNILLSIARLKKQNKNQIQLYFGKVIDFKRCNHTYNGHLKSKTLASPAARAVTKNGLCKLQSAPINGDLVSMECTICRLSIL